MQLHRNNVLDAAVSILDEYGLADLTMRRLASALSVQPGALYWHFPNKQTLLAAVADRILAPMDDPIGDAPWDRQATTLAHRLRDCLLSHRDGAELVSATYASRLTTSRARERFVSACLRAGMERADAELAGFTLLYYVLGQTVDEQARLQLDSVGVLDEDASPLFETPDATARFDFGLQLFVAGVVHRLGDRIRS